MSKRPLYLRLLVALALGLSLVAQAADTSASDPKTDTRSEAQPSAMATDPSYRLSAGDTILFNVYNQELTTTQTIGRGGDVRLPLIQDEIILSGKTVREAERFLENLYRDKKLLKKPVVSVKVANYFPRSVSVLGAVNTPGTLNFPPDTVSIDIVEAITRSGGFRTVAKSEAVTVTRRGADGKETSQTLDLRNIMSGRRRAGVSRIDYPIYPGDRIWVPESLF